MDINVYIHRGNQPIALAKVPQSEPKDPKPPIRGLQAAIVSSLQLRSGRIPKHQIQLRQRWDFLPRNGSDDVYFVLTREINW